MNRIDNDLFSIQEARILVENAMEAQKLLACFPNEKLDEVIGCIVKALRPHMKELAMMSSNETGYGKWEDKCSKNIFVCDFLLRQLEGQRYIGIIKEDKQNKTMDIGVPVGVIAALPPSTNPVSTTIYKTLLAMKSGNAIVFSPHIAARKSISSVLDIMTRAAESCGIPKGSISYLHTLTRSGTAELMNHKDTALILITGVPGMLKQAAATGKQVIYGGPGNGPAFIEASADIEKAVNDIIRSKTFDNGIVSAAEQAVVVDGCIAEKVRCKFEEMGAHFMSDKESEKVGNLLFLSDGSPNKEIIGKSASFIAEKAGICVRDNSKILLSPQKYVSLDNPYSRENLCPVLAFYVEPDWRYACEKCIELLVSEGRGHTLVIHSKNEEVIREFALKKPVSRVLINTPATLGGMGATTNLFPAMTLGSGATGGGVTADNVSPINLIHIRKVGYDVRSFEGVTGESSAEKKTDNEQQNLEDIFKKIVEQFL